MDYQIFNEDCLEGMKRIPDGSVDMILTDLPYGILKCDWDTRVPFTPMWEQFNRVTKKNAAVVLFAQMPFGAELIMSNKKFFKYMWVWEKAMPSGFLNVAKMPMHCHEEICVFYRALPTYNPQLRPGKPYKRKAMKAIHSVFQPIKEKFISQNDTGLLQPRDVIYFNSVFGSKVERCHPTQKPTDLLEYLIRTYTDEGETVLDATMGSGSTGVACANTNRNFIGFELEEKFFDIAGDRIQKAVNENLQKLF